MVNETLGVEIEEMTLRYGLRALLVSGRDDRPAYVPPPPAVKHRRRDPMTGQRRDVPALFELEQEEANRL
jgi:hypothetical protein